MFLKILIILNAFLFISTSHAQQSQLTEKVVCGKAKSSNKEWKYCLHQYPNSSRKVLYYFHGIFGNEKSWKSNELEKNIVRRWMERGEKPPVVVSISFGPIWLLAERNSSGHSGLFEIMRDQIIPTVQKRLLAFNSEENWLMGVSMGGLNASQLYFKTHQFFSRAAIICGAMAVDSPHAPKAVLDDYTRRTRANPFLVWLSVQMTRTYFPTELDWHFHSPVQLALMNSSALSTPLYVSNGTSDEFGFHEGNIAFAEIAKSRGTDARIDLYPNQSHCWVDSKPIADFFMEKKAVVAKF